MISPLRSRHLLTFCLWLFAFGLSASAQTIQLRDGTSVPTQTLRRDGDTLLAKLKTKDNSVAEVGYPLSNVTRVDFPEPALLKTAPDLLDKGRVSEAVQQLNAAAAYYLPFYNVPGNYWKELALLQLEALTAAHSEKEADTVAIQLTKIAGNDPDVARTLKVREASNDVQHGDVPKALGILEPLVREDVPASLLAPVWVQIGAARLAKRDFKPALLAYLHVPVYTPDLTRLMPPALLGSARAYLGLQDKTRAEASLNQLVSAYPAAPEAAAAKQELQQLNGPAPEPTPSS